jgi:hypothetical protein
MNTQGVFFCNVAHSVVQSVERLRYKPEGRGFFSRWGSEFSLDLIPQPHYGPRVDSACSRNKGKARPTREAKNPIAIWEPIVHNSSFSSRYGKISGGGGGFFKF